MKSVASMLAGLALFGMSAAPSWTQEHAQDYPNRQVNFIVPFAPGGGTDILGRLVGQKLSIASASRS
jgi:tripartite-type tricarboxylate transporter receptor subunit TctC